MIEVENELRELLRSKADEVPVSAELPHALARHGRRLRLLNGTLAVTLALVAGFGGYAGIRAAVLSTPPRPADVSPGPVPSPAPSPSTSPSPSPSPSPPATLPPLPPSDPAGFPGSFLALTVAEGEPAGRLVEVDAAGGEPIRTIIDFVDYSEGAPSHFAFHPDGPVVFYTRGVSACENVLAELTLDGGEPQDLGAGWAPSISPDGTLLAFATADGGFCGSTEQELVVQNLETGTESRWKLGFQPATPGYGLCGTSWFPDGRRLAFNLCSEPGNTLHVLDVEADPGVTLGEVPPLGPEGDSLSLIGYHAPSGGIAALHECSDAQRMDGTCTVVRTVVVVDQESGAVLETLFTVAESAWSVDLDGAGRSFIWAEERGVFASDGGAPVKLTGREYVSATW